MGVAPDVADDDATLGYRAIDSRPLKQFDCQSNALAAANAQRDEASLQTVATHRVNKSRRQDCSCCPDWVPVRNGSAFHVHDFVVQSEFYDYSERNRRKCFVNL